MSDTERKVFPMETALALAVGNEDVDVKDMVGFLTGQSIECPCCARVLGPLAAGWLAKLYPDFGPMEWDSATPWKEFVAGMKQRIGDSVSVPAMGESFKKMAANLLGILGDQNATILAQKAEIADLQAKVDVMTPMQAKAEELQKKCDQFEAKIKSMTTDMGALRKELMPFQGKMAVDQQELMTMIKDAIKDNMKGFVAAGGAAAAGVAAADGAVAAPEEEPANDGGPAADFGFGASGADSDGFGF